MATTEPPFFFFDCHVRPTSRTLKRYSHVEPSQYYFIVSWWLKWQQEHNSPSVTMAEKQICQQSNEINTRKMYN